MRVLCFANQKGGVGKTTAALTVSSILSSRGYRVLFIDMDAQCNSTDTLGGKTGDNVATVYDLLLDPDPITLSDAVQRLSFLDLVPGDVLMREADDILKDDPDFPYRLRRILESQALEYDFTVLDTSPSIDRLLIMALTACSSGGGVLLPCEADRYSLQGLSQISDTINAARATFNPDLNVIGIIINKFSSRTLLAQDMYVYLETIVSESIGCPLMKSTLRQANDVKMAGVAHQTVDRYAPRSKITADYKALTDEILKAIGEK